MSVMRATIDPPAASDLLLLVAQFLEKELAPAQNDPKFRFRTRVAANLLRIAGRELEGCECFRVDADGYALPAELLAQAGSLRALASELYDGRRDLTDPNTFALLSRYVEAKLKVAAPEFLAEQDALG
jgi:hypothetical protein